ncbi:S-adenosyl-L-methionine-dependent methyltransferase [Cladochytrium replicatum]|nr:S-adenosyl-L-methionine-dependent methyltransferase [Cladochytrium replicatum]
MVVLHRKFFPPLLLATAISVITVFLWTKGDRSVVVDEPIPSMSRTWYSEELRKKLLDAIASQVIAENKDNLFQAKVLETNFQMYLHPSPELVSDAIRKDGYWRDCVQYHLASIQRLLLDDTRPNVVVDVGGNIGSCSLMFGAMGARVVAFEPAQKNFRLFAASIRANIEAGILNENGNKSISLNPVAVADTDDVKTIYSQKGNNGNSIIAKTENQNGREVSELDSKTDFVRDSIITVRLSDIIKERVGLMKMDCQGYEPLVLRGMKDLVENYGVDQINFEFEPSMALVAGTNITEVLWTLDAWGYSLVKVNDNTVLLPSEFEKFEAKFPKTGYSGEDLIAYSKKVFEKIPPS